VVRAFPLLEILISKKGIMGRSKFEAVILTSPKKHLLVVASFLISKRRLSEADKV